MLNFGVQTPDFGRVQALLSHIPGAAEKAMSRAINKAVNSAKAEAAREVKNRYAIGMTEFQRGIKIIPATRSRLSARLIATSSLHAISKFGLKSGKSGEDVSTEIVRGKMTVWPHGFLAKMPGGHKGLFTRSKEYFLPHHGKYAHTKTKEASRGQARSEVGQYIRRQRIIEKFSVSTAEMVGYGKIIDVILEKAEEKLSGELDRQIGLFLRGEVS